METERKEIVMPESRDFKGIWIFKNLYLSRDYTPNEKFLLLEIYSLSKGRKKQCYANNKHFADFIGVKENTIQKAILKLEKNGHIVREYTYRDGTKEISGRIITLTQKFYDDFINESQVSKEPENSESEVVDKNPQGGGNKSIHKYNNISNTYYAFTESYDSEKGTLCSLTSVSESAREEEKRYPIEDVPYLIKKYADRNIRETRLKNLSDIIVYFIDVYTKNSNTEHMSVSETAIKNIIDGYINATGKVKDADVWEYKEIINDYFATNYKMDGRPIVKSLQHFFSGKIRENLYLKMI